MTDTKSASAPASAQSEVSGQTAAAAAAAPTSGKRVVCRSNVRELAQLIVGMSGLNVDEAFMDRLVERLAPNATMEEISAQLQLLAVNPPNDTATAAAPIPVLRSHAQ